MQGNIKPEVKPMIENLQEKLHLRNCKQSKGPKICVSIRWELECKCSKTFCKIFGRQNMQNRGNKLINQINWKPLPVLKFKTRRNPKNLPPPSIPETF